jgi:hypothetical protein
MAQEFRPTEAALIRKENKAVFAEHNNFVFALRAQTRSSQSLADLQRVYDSAVKHDNAMWNEYAIRTHTDQEIERELYHATTRISEVHVPIPVGTVHLD